MVSPVSRLAALAPGPMHPVFNYSQSDFANILRYLRGESEVDDELSRQLHCELNEYIVREVPAVEADGIKHSPLYQRLPLEVRQHIYSYIVVVPESIHIYPVKGNDRHGFRLSKCGEALMDLRNGWCKCENGRRNNAHNVTAHFFDTELLLVSKTVRREVMDVMFLRNHFTFTSLRDLTTFTTNFTTSAAKLQSIRVFESLSDSPASPYATKNATKARQRIGHLTHLSLYGYLSGYTSYNNYHDDGYITQMMHFAFPPPESFTCVVQPGGLYAGEHALRETAARVQAKLEQVFTGTWPDVESVPLSEPPPKKVREDEIPPLVKRGILALGD